MTRGLRTAAIAAAVVGVLAVAGPPAALAAPRGLEAGCVTHGLTITPLGNRTMVDTYVDNECGADRTFTITYWVLGPCPHTTSIGVSLPEGAWDVVTTYRGPCSGRYTARQRLVADGARVGQDTVEFDTPGG